MATITPIDLDHVLLDPRSVFKVPAEVLARADFDAARKREILERWRHDALEPQTADDEAMSGGLPPEALLAARAGIEHRLQHALT